MEKLYSEEFEKHLLGCMLIDNSIIDDVTAHLKENYFMKATHQLFFKQIKLLYEENQSCDPLMLCNAIITKHSPEIIDLTTGVASSANYEFYMNQIHKFYIARETRRFIGEITDSISEKTIDDTLYQIDDFVNACMTDVSKKEPVNAKKMAINIIETIQERQAHRGELTGLDCGYDKLNKLTNGFQKGSLVAIGARTSMGKSALSDQICMNMAERKIPTVTFSLEMTAMELQERRAAVLGNVFVNKIRSGFLSSADCQRINNATQKLFDFGDDLLLYDSESISCEFNEIVSKIRIHAKQGYKAFFIDHIGLVECMDKEGLPEWEKTKYITKRFKQLANKLGIVIFLVCQLNRDSEGKDPQLNNIRGAGSVEEDANVVILIHRERQHNDEVVIPTKIKVLKNRGGACGDIDFNFYPGTTKFEEASTEQTQVVKQFEKVEKKKEESYEEANLPF